MISEFEYAKHILFDVLLNAKEISLLILGYRRKTRSTAGFGQRKTIFGYK